MGSRQAWAVAALVVALVAAGAGARLLCICD